jgi:hypothetical protein
MMGAETVPETSIIFKHLILMVTAEVEIAASHSCHYALGE